MDDSAPGQYYIFSLGLFVGKFGYLKRKVFNWCNENRRKVILETIHQVT